MPLRLVYIDDEPQLCLLLKENLESENIIVETFTDWDEALKSIAANPPDFVFLDYRLKDANGDEVAARIHPSIPKCLLTGDNLKLKDHPLFIKIFFKPFEYDAIEALLENFIAK